MACRVLLATLVVVLAAACTGDLDCSLNGVCVAGGRCVCDAGWRGAVCGNLSLGVTDPTLGLPWGSTSSSLHRMAAACAIASGERRSAHAWSSEVAMPL